MFFALFLVFDERNLQSLTRIKKHIMRKISNLAIIATGVALITVLASCTKEDAPRQTFTPSNWENNLKAVVDEQMSKSHNSSSALKKNGWACGAADAGGALAGAAAGADIGSAFVLANPSAPLIGIIGGGIIGGAAASIGYWWGKVIEDGVPGGPTIYNPTIENPFADKSNPYRYAGILHNEICKKAIDDSIIFMPDSAIYFQDRMNDIGYKIINERKGEFAELANLEFFDIGLDYNAINTPIISNAESLSIQVESTNEDIALFCREFQRGLNYCSSEEDVYNLVKKMNSVIMNSDLDENVKRQMLISTSVLENSVWLWRF